MAVFLSFFVFSVFADYRAFNMVVFSTKTTVGASPGIASGGCNVWR
jgi:hypothetical protein